MNSPCLDCPKREIACHAHCPEYRAFDQENEQRRQERSMWAAVMSMTPQLKKNLRRKAMAANHK